MIKSNLSPICLFVYNRPIHTLKALECLANNNLSNDSILYVFCDGPKSDSSDLNTQNINAVRNIVKSKNWCKKVYIYESDNNKGLASSIIEGVTFVVNKYGKIIVLEDDILVGDGFLKYMNDALNQYENEFKVMQISGYSYPINHLDKSNKAFFLGITSTWGWGTWKRVWDDVNFNLGRKEVELISKNKKYIKSFNFYNTYNYLKLLKLQVEKKNVSSWGILFYWNVFIRSGLVLYPDYSLVNNIGWDNTGRHNTKYQLYDNDFCESNYHITDFPNDLNVDMQYQQSIVKYLRVRNSFFYKLFRLFIMVIKKMKR